jgi:hypothetical protein
MKSGIIYKGPSRIDGAPIVVLATYSNRNTKTGSGRADVYLAREISTRLKQARRAQTLAFAAHAPCAARPRLIQRASKPSAAGAMST